MEHFMAITEELFNISGKRVVITGGTGGIGAGLVSGFLAAGTQVVVSARNEESAAQARATYSGNTNVRFIEADLMSDQSIQHFISQANATLGGIDVLIQAHGNVFPGPATQMSLDTWHEQIQVNLTATFRLAQAVAPQMIERKKGKIINIASMLTFQGGLNASGYAAAKGGVGQLTKALSNEWAPHGVNVNAIAPGYIKTKLNKHIWTDPVRHDQVLARLTSGRWGEPADLVGPALFLAATASDYLHGVLLPVDGGWLSR
ncbi:MAG: SDR family NAD(P)-dependent oxidoreductase [Actinobacteria bacterium]|nr:SDR family NAD(P)-dependent oxidoreductase [Actinomycetota bacterium]